MKALLKDVEPHEVSLVHRAANRRRYLLLKNESGGSKVNIDAIKDILGTEAENEESFKAVLSKSNVEDDGAEGLISAFRLFNAYRESASPEVMASLLEAMGVESAAPAATETTDTSEVSKSDGKPDLSKVPDEIRGQVEKLFKSMEDKEKQIATLREQVEKSQRESRRREFVEKAEQMPHIPTPDGVSFVDVLMGLADKAPEEYAALEQILTSVDQTIEKSDLFKSYGNAGATRSGTAEAELKQRAEAIRKSDSSVSLADAMDRVFEQDKDLQRRYLEEKR